MGWLLLLLLIGATLAAMRLLGVTGAMLKLAGAALLLGACGYALQGRPGLAGAAAGASEGTEFVPLTNARHAFFGQFSGSEHWLRISESMARRGKTQDAAGILRAGIREQPQNLMLWIGLGNALVDHAGVMTPPAELAYQRAEEIVPGHPATPFFRGLALARSGDPAAAIAIWHNLLAAAPADASWRPLVEDGVAALTPAAERQKQAQPR